jgi:LuxR family maltose regulon positive regulatory protein
LFERVGGAARVTQVVAPAGSGKTVLLRSWIGQAGLAEHSAWVAVKDKEMDPQRFWLAVADALRGTAGASALVRPLAAAPDVDGWMILERLLEDLAPLASPVWLVIDDAHELVWDDAMCQLEVLLERTAPALRLVLASRRDLPLTLHRLRLEGRLSEIRAADLAFTVEEARTLLEAADVRLSEVALAQLHARAEGWAAGLRLAAMSLAGHPDPERFAAEFSGSERTVADYLLAEVLERQPDEVQRLLLRTSVLHRVNGELADLLTGGTGGHRALQQLEAAGAFVTSVDAGRSWFRFHRLFADLLQVEIRRIAPDEPILLHAVAAEWFAGHGYPLDAIQHAQAARDWGQAARLLADHWVDLELDGRAATAHELLAGFPAGVVAADAELTVLRAGDELARGSREEAERQLALADQRRESVPADRGARFQLLFAVARLFAARQRGDLAAMAGQADSLLAALAATDEAELDVGDDLRALALINLGIAEACAARVHEADQHVDEADRQLAQADRHLEQGVALARRTGRSYLELVGLAHAAEVASYRGVVAEPRSRQAIQLAEQHGWQEDQAAAGAYLVLGAELVARGCLAEGEPWLDRAAQAVRPESEPALAAGLHSCRGLLELATGRFDKALAEFRASDRLATALGRHVLSPNLRARILLTLLKMGQTRRAEAILAESDDHERAALEMRTARAVLELARRRPEAATAALAPAVGGSLAVVHPMWMVAAVLVEAIARDALGDPDAAAQALERALDLAEPGRWLLPFLLHPAPRLLERHLRQGTAHAALAADILTQLTGTTTPEPSPSRQAALREPLSQAETRVLRYLPSGLSVPEIAGELYVSKNTVRTHLRHIYDKLETHRRHEAIERARALGLIGSSASRSGDGRSTGTAAPGG